MFPIIEGHVTSVNSTSDSNFPAVVVPSMVHGLTRVDHT